MSTVLIALLLAGAPSATRTFVVDPAASVVRYHVNHKLHEVDARTSKLEGKAVLQPDGKVLAMFRAPVGSFDSGDGNRDQHMQETMETAKHPFVVFKGIAQLGGSALVASGETAADVSVQGELELHGVKKAVQVPVHMDIRPDGTARAKGSFVLSLEAHGIERPSLLFVKLDDACRIDIDLALNEVKP
jgi:polyisoprenoid-binding protein YceI